MRNPWLLKRPGADLAVIFGDRESTHPSIGKKSRHVGKTDGSIMGCNPGAKATSIFHPTLGHFEMIASRPKRKRCSTRPNRSCNSLLRRTWSFQPFRLYRDGHGNLARPRTERNASGIMRLRTAGEYRYRRTASMRVLSSSPPIPLPQTTRVTNRRQITSYGHNCWILFSMGCSLRQRQDCSFTRSSVGVVRSLMADLDWSLSSPSQF